MDSKAGSSGTSSRYRADIDGLRAIAILPILLFHAGFSLLSGGFIGVDVFFIISGFLITGIIDTDLRRGTFSLARFYRRRVVRIVPALLSVLFGVLILGCLLMLPQELKALGRSAAFTAVFASNIYFADVTGYFYQTSDLIPLLHTWSLGVEEQFYIFYPPILLLIYRFWGSRTRLLIGGLAFLSFLIGLYYCITWPKIGFFLLPCRAWELGIGALVSLGAFPHVQRSRTREVLAVVGLGMIVSGLFLIHDTSIFPTPWALLPATGAALIIAYGQGTLVDRILSLAPIVWLGQISYSLYLWHWPLIAFYRLEFGVSLSNAASLELIAASMLAAMLSYYLIEKPFIRRLRFGEWHWPVLASGVVALSVFCAISFLVASEAASIRPLSGAVARIAAFDGYAKSPERRHQFGAGDCFLEGATRAKTFDYQRCLRWAPKRANVLLMGDSYAAQFAAAMREHYPDVNIQQATVSGCRPTLHPTGEQQCTRMVNEVLNVIIQRRHFKAVFLAGRWQPGDLALLEATIIHLRAHSVHVFVIGPMVEYESDMPDILARAMISNNSQLMSKALLKEKFDLDGSVRQHALRAGASYISVVDLECPQRRCQTRSPDGGPMHFDYGHLTLDAARWVVRSFPAIDETGAR